MENSQERDWNTDDPVSNDGTNWSFKLLSKTSDDTLSNALYTVDKAIDDHHWEGLIQEADDRFIIWENSEERSFEDSKKEKGGHRPDTSCYHAHLGVGFT